MQKQVRDYLLMAALSATGLGAFYFVMPPRTTTAPPKPRPEHSAYKCGGECSYEDGYSWADGDELVDALDCPIAPDDFEAGCRQAVKDRRESEVET